MEADSIVRPPGDTDGPKRAKILSWKPALLWAAGAVGAFHLAYGSPPLSWLMVGYLFCLVQLARMRTGRQAFYFGLGVGFLTLAPQLTCFWVIFKAAAIALWLVLAFWVALFVAVARVCLLTFPSRASFLLIPFVWTGLEYFRSELYYLRFSWLNVGYVLSGSPFWGVLHWVGMYGAGFLAASIAVALFALRTRAALLLAGCLVIGAIALEIGMSGQSRPTFFAPSWGVPKSEKRTIDF